MSFLRLIERWVQERPPDFLFEVAESGISCASPAGAATHSAEDVPSASLVPSPAAPNVLKPDILRAAVARLAPPPSGRKPTAAVILPDYAVRMAILDFDAWPADTPQQTALVRFRLKKSVPFPIDEARVSFSVQRTAGGGKTEVLAVAIDQKILSEYETIFTDSGYRVGLVMPSGVACLSLFHHNVSSGRPELALLLKLSGTILTVLLLEGSAIRLVRCVDFSRPASVDSEALAGPVKPFSAVEDTLPVLTQTLAYAEDEIGRRVDRLLLSGFGVEATAIGSIAESEYQLPWDVLHSRFAESRAQDGLLGLLERYAA